MKAPKGMRTYRKGSQYEHVAHPQCEPGFREDRRHGLIYGPYMLKFPDGTRRFAMHAEEASRLTRTCAYCGDV